MFGEDVLSSYGYLVLVTIVAFNTLIYVGLTVAKALPWPEQWRPVQLRAWMDRLGVRIEERTTATPPALTGEGESPVDRLRYQVARQSIPPAFWLAGGLVMMLAGLAAFTVDDIPFGVHVLEFLCGLGLLVTGAALWYGSHTGRTMIWCFAGASTFLALLLVAEAALLQVPSPINYALLLMVAAMPVLVDRGAALLSGTAILLGVFVFALVSGGPFGVRLFVLSASALLVGATLLEVRLRAIEAIGSEIALSEATATTDPVTGLLTRRGLMTLVPGLAANAARSGQPVCLVRVRVARLGATAQLYGGSYADTVMRTVGEAARANTRAGDLVARSGQDDLTIVGAGHAPDPGQFRERLDEHIRAAGISLGRVPVELYVATTAGDPGADTFDGLLRVIRPDDV